MKLTLWHTNNHALMRFIGIRQVHGLGGCAMTPRDWRRCLWWGVRNLFR